VRTTLLSLHTRETRSVEWHNFKWQEVLKNFSESIYYATKWGKRIRAVFALEFYLILSWKKFEEISFEDDIIKLCVAIEFLHAYSLVHDDLPAMDNDTYRRWELTIWKKYWEANGILVWDLLNSLAFETLWNIENKEVWMELIKRFWQAVWFYWMIWWQVLDLYFEKKSNELNFENLIETHNKKTGALITFSIVWWVLLWAKSNKENTHLAKHCHAELVSASFEKQEQDLKSKHCKINEFWYEKDPEINSGRQLKLQKYLDFWKEIWLAFQVKDDLLDVEWTFEETGKSIGWEKKWFIHLIWIEKSKEHLKELISNCLKNIKELNSEKLNFLVEYIGNRSR
jgi:geranylgeranyl pyrophosphate synthase